MPKKQSKALTEVKKYAPYEQHNEAAKEAAAAAIRSIFSSPIMAGNRKLSLVSVEFGEDPDGKDFSKQLESKLKGKIWGTKVYGVFQLEDTSTGKVLDKGRILLLTLPVKTARYTYLVGGQEYQFDYQFRRKPGVYTRITDNGEYAASIAASGNFYQKTEMFFDPETKKYVIKFGSLTVPVSAVLNVLGVSPDEVIRAVGKEIAAVNLKPPTKSELNKLVRAFSKTGETPKVSDLRTRIEGGTFDPEATKYTLGKEYTKFDSALVLATMKKLLKVATGEEEEDDPNSLITKDVLYYDDYIKEWIEKGANDAKRKISNNLSDANKVSDIVQTHLLAPNISKLFQSPLSQRREQHNIIDILSGVGRTTLRGPGGISDPNMIRDDMRTIHPSHLGFLDPIKTPEGSSIGTTLYLTSTTIKKGNKLASLFWDLKKKEKVWLTPDQVYDSYLGFPDEYEFGDNKSVPKPKKAKVSASHRGDIVEVPASKIDYIPASPSGMFHTTTNLIPFLRSNNGVRAMTASRQVEQAIPLVNRESPLVQVSATTDNKISMERLLGENLGAIKSPVDGKIKSIKNGYISIAEDKTGKVIKVPYYDHFPLNNNKGYIHTELYVKPGDSVKRGSLIGDTNFTKDGQLALGTNLRVAYLPWKGLTFEDAVVVSESAAKKLTSDHLHQFEIPIDADTIVGKSKFESIFPNDLDAQKSSKLDSDGVIKKGETVDAGDFIYVGMRKKKIDPDSEIVLRISKKALSNYSDASIKWEKKYPGKVVKVEKYPKKFVVHVLTQEPAVAGDKIVGRHGNKGIIAKVVPDDEMPRGEDGKPFEILMNPAGVIGRINLGQVFETVMGKAAKKSGKPIIINNFESDKNTYDEVLKLAKKYGVKDSEIVTDPENGPTEKPVLTGYQYIVKLTHQVDKKLAARGAQITSEGERLPYTIDKTPARGGKYGGQGLGLLDVFGLLAHGATENLNEMFTYKGDISNADFWTALKNGSPLPDPKVPYTAKKFVAYLQAMGINVERGRDKLQILPMTDKEVEELSSGELTNPSEALDYKFRPIKGGIFDSIRTGGLSGEKWSHINLPSPVVNPITKDAVLRILAYLYPDYGGKLLDNLLAGKVGVTKDKKIVSIESADYVGGEAVKHLLTGLDIDKLISRLREDLKKAPASKVNIYNKTLKYLLALKKLGLKPEEAYILTKIPVLPPSFRPVIAKDESSPPEMDDINGLYKKLGEVVRTMKETKMSYLPPEKRAERVKHLQDMVEALTVSGYSVNNRPLRSIMQIITGSSPKYGYYHSKVLKRRQDLSGRTTITPDPELPMDTVAVPKKMLWETFSPFVIKNLMNSGYSSVEAHKHLKEKTPAAEQALMAELKERPILLKRDPVLHKFGIQAFYARPTEGDTIKIPPSVTSGYNADFDGDTMAMFVPATEQAKEEAKKMVPSKNLFNPQNAQLMHKPDHEAQLGLYLLTEPGKDTKLTFSSIDQAIEAFRARRIKVNDLFSYKGKKTSLGRLFVANALPKGRVREEWYNKIAYDRNFKLSDKEVKKILETTAKVQPSDFPKILQQLRVYGDFGALVRGGSFSLKDFKPLSAFNKKLPDNLKSEKDIHRYERERSKIESQAKDQLSKSDNNLMKMIRSGARGNWDQMKQIVLSPGLLTNANGTVAKKPINRSYAEGLSLSEYWLTLHGARRGMVSKVRGTQLPGYLSRQLITSMADVKVVEDDCQTSNGVEESISDPDIIGRYLSKAQKIGKTNYPKNTLVDHKILSAAKSGGRKTLWVRSPLTCSSHDGVCAKCFGKWHDGELPPIGVNLGVISGQAIGERGTQLAMKMFHEGGVKGKTTQAVDQLTMAKQILEAPQKIKNEAVLARATGTVSSIKKEPTGYTVVINGVSHFVSKNKELLVKKGQFVTKGQPISGGTPNVHKVVDLLGTPGAQKHLVQSLDNIYRPMGVNKRHLEVAARYMTSLSVVEDAPESTGFLRGDVVPTAQIEAFNKREVPVDWAIGHTLATKVHTFSAGTKVTDSVARALKEANIKKVKIRDLGGTIKAKPIVRGVNTLPLLRNPNDWAAKASYERIQDAITTGAMTGGVADLSGKFPLSAAGFGKIKPSQSKI